MKIILKSRCQGKQFQMTHYFLNEDHTYRPCGVMEWAQQFESANRHVAEDFINDYRISTVWMGINIHNFDPPLVFETMIFRHGKEVYLTRSSTWDEAKKTHEVALNWVKRGCKEDEQ